MLFRSLDSVYDRILEDTGYESELIAEHTEVRMLVGGGVVDVGALVAELGHIGQHDKAVAITLPFLSGVYQSESHTAQNAAKLPVNGRKLPDTSPL